MEKNAVLFYLSTLHPTQKQLLVDEKRRSLLERVFKADGEFNYSGDDPLVPIMIKTVQELKEGGITITDIDNSRTDILEILKLDPLALENELESEFASLIQRVTRKALESNAIQIMNGSDFFLDLETKYGRLIDLVYLEKLSTYGKDLERIVKLLSALKSTGRPINDCKRILNKTVIRDGFGTVNKVYTQTNGPII